MRPERLVLFRIWSRDCNPQIDFHKAAGRLIFDQRRYRRRKDDDF